MSGRRWQGRETTGGDLINHLTESHAPAGRVTCCWRTARTEADEWRGEEGEEQQRLAERREELKDLRRKKGNSSNPFCHPH